MSQNKINGFVIRTTRMTESSRVVTLFTREFGKVKAVAKGVGKPKSKMSGVIEMFNLIEGLLYKKENSDLGTLSSASVLNSYARISIEPKKFGFGSAWCEVLDRTSFPDHPRPLTFELTKELLKSLDTISPDNAGLLFWSGLYKMLLIEGYSPRLEGCISCGNGEFTDIIDISFERGGLLCSKCANNDEASKRITKDALALMRNMGSVEFERLTELNLSKKTGREAADIILSLASYHLGLPRNLKSFKFLDSIAD